MTAEVAGLLADTALAGSGIFPVAAPSGTGVEVLKKHLVDLATAKSERPAIGNFRLAVDRSFVIRGAGTVVTGTVHAGRAKVGDRLFVAPAMREVRLRAVHAQDRPSEEARTGWRCALNLVGVERGDVTRGDWIVAEGAPAPSRRLDIRLSVLTTEERPLKHWAPIHLHHGAAHVTGHVAMIGAGSIAPGDSGLAQLVLDTPAVAATGDRLVLRDQSARRTVGGGWMIDPYGPARGRAKPERIARLEAMDATDHGSALAALLGLPGPGVVLDTFRRARNLTPDEADNAFNHADMVVVGRGDEAVGLARARWSDLLDDIAGAVASWHGEHADRLGPAPEELRRDAGWRHDRLVMQEVLTQLVADGRLARRGMVVHVPGHDVRLGPKDEALWAELRGHLNVAEGRPTGAVAAGRNRQRRSRGARPFPGPPVRHGPCHAAWPQPLSDSRTSDRLRGHCRNTRPIGGAGPDRRQLSRCGGRRAQFRDRPPGVP